MFSISAGLICDATPAPETATPSIINNGSLDCPALIDEIPRIVICEEAFGEPPEVLTLKPEILPCKVFTKLVLAPPIISSESKLCTA